MISRKGSGLSHPNRNLDGANRRRSRGLRRLEVEFQRLLQIGQCPLFGVTLTRDIDLHALGNIPVSFAPNGCGERSFQGFILSHARKAWSGLG